MIMVDDAHSPEMVQLVKGDPMLNCMGNVALAIFLLKELSEGSDSFWAPYLNSLPREYHTVLHFTPDDIALLKGSPTQGKVTRFSTVGVGSLLAHLNLGSNHPFLESLAFA